MLGKSLKRVQFSLTGVLFSFAFMNVLSANEPINGPVGPAAGLALMQEQQQDRGTTVFEQAFLKASNANADDNFGVEIAINEAGTILVVGARYEDSDGSGPEDNSIQDAGAAYVFERQINGDWIETAYLKPSLPYFPGPAGFITGYQFGLAVGISGETIVIGEPFRDIDGIQAGIDFNEGAVYVFEPDENGDWVETDVLLSSRPNPSQDEFGTAVAISGDRLLIGAQRETRPGIGRNGSVRAYTRNSNGLWEEEDVLFPDAEPSDMYFGNKIALDNNRAIISAPLESSDGSSPNDQSKPFSGAAFIFERDPNGQWDQVAYLKASNVDEDDSFGQSVGISGNVAAVGANSEDSDGSDPGNNTSNAAGAVYIFEPNESGDWVQTQFIKSPDLDSFSHFGFSLDLEDQSLLVGANIHEQQQGTSYLFAQNEQSSWVFQQRIIPDIRGSGDRFGHQVARGGGRFLISSWWESSDPDIGPGDSSLTRSGAVYLFGLPGLTVGGQVSGLIGNGLVLRNTQTDDDVSIVTNGDFTFPVPLQDGESYAVSVLQQPDNPEQTCTVSDGTGILSGQDVTDIDINCVLTETFTLGGIATGVNFTGLMLQNNGSDDLTIISPGGPFTFDTELANGENYEVTIIESSIDPTHVCSVSNGSGTINSSDVSDVLVECSFRSTFPIEAEVTGLTGSGLVLQNNGGDDLAIPNNGTFRFATELELMDSYSVTVATQPSNPAQACVVNNGSGIVGEISIITVEVVCETAQYEIGGMVSGLPAPGLTLFNNGTDFIMINADGPFIFPTLLEDGQSYNVTIGLQPEDPSGGECLVANGTGMVNGMNVNNIQVTCGVLPTTFSLGGTVSGLKGIGLVLQNNGTDSEIINQNGPFSFSIRLSDSEPYTVTVASQPDGGIEQCQVSNGTGVVDGMDVTDIQIDCTALIADLTISKTNGFAFVDNGVSTTWFIEIKNVGAVDIIGATLSDPLPAGVTNASWNCSGSDGGICPNANGSGSINEVVDLSVGSTLSYEFTATVTAMEGSVISNTATITLPPAQTDINPANNSATDTDPVGLFADGFEDELD